MAEPSPIVGGQGFKDNETKLFLKLDAKSVGDMAFDSDGKHLFFVADGKMLKVALEKKDLSFSAEMTLNVFAERAYLFEHAWRQVVKKFYVTNLQQTDWNYYKENYARFLPHINNNRDFAEMMSKLLGELNASHTGCRYNPKFKKPDETASIGAYFDESYTGAGLKIAEVIEKGPFVSEGSQIKAGTIEKIDGVEITPETNYCRLLNRTAGKYMLLSLYDEATKKRWEQTIKPIPATQLTGLLYNRWVKRMQDRTGGKMDKAIGCFNGRRQLLRCAHVPGRIQNPEHWKTDRHAGSGNRHGCVAGNPAGPYPGIWYPAGGCNDPRLKILREQPTGAGH